jgi:hypothetical protein
VRYVGDRTARAPRMWRAMCACAGTGLPPLGALDFARAACCAGQAVQRSVDLEKLANFSHALTDQYAAIISA